MSAEPDFPALAKRVELAVGELPRLLQVRRLEAYAVDISSVEVLIEDKLAAVDHAVLSLVAAQGRASVHDLRRFLGLGVDVSVITARRLVWEGLLEDQDAEGRDEARRDAWQSNLLGSRPPDTDYTPSRARVVEEVEATPRQRYLVTAREGLVPEAERRPLVLSARGRASLDAGKRVSIRNMPVRLVMWADPVRFLEVAAQKRGSVPPATGGAVEAPHIPEPLRKLEGLLALDPEERQRRIALGRTAQGLPGVLLRMSANASWSVRHANSRMNLLVNAWFGSQNTPTAFAGHVRALERWEGVEDQPALFAPASDEQLAADLTRQGLDAAPRLGAPNGAVLVLADATRIAGLIGTADEPGEVWLPLDSVSQWRRAVRIRALPRDGAAAQAALVALLTRQIIRLKSDLRRTIRETWATLARFWGDPAMPMPAEDAVVAELWLHPASRGAICEARLRSDLIDPYLEVA